MKTVTVYRNRNGVVEKLAVDRLSPLLAQDSKGVDYHQRIINTYHELDCAGKLGDMSGRAKTFVRDVHVAAQSPDYWKE